MCGRSLSLLGLLLALSAGGLAAGESPRRPVDIYDEALVSVVSLEVVTHSGEKFGASGFVTGQAGLIATAWHVVHDARTIRAIFADGTQLPAFKIPAGFDPGHDLALLRLEQPYGLPVRLSSGNARVASTVYVIGSPRGYSFSIVDGLISQVQRIDGYDQYQISCPISPGNSGAPVFDDSGIVVGLVSWSKRGAQNLNFAIPVSHLSELLRDNTSPAPEIQLGFGDEPPVSSPVRMKSPLVAGDADKDWTRLRRFLSERPGKAAAIRVQVEGEVESFELVLPATPTSDAMLVGGNLGE